MRSPTSNKPWLKWKTSRKALPAPLRREVHRLHRNLGHPAKDVFVRALRHSGVRADILDLVKVHFRCPTRDARSNPSLGRPGHLTKALEFNVVIGIDLIFVDVFEEAHIMLNCLCWGANFQQVSRCKNKTAKEVKNVFWSEWLKHYGCPQLIILDRGKELFGNQFQDGVGGVGIALNFTDPESPWQNSRTERAGGIFKENLKAVIHHMSATKDELDLCIARVVTAERAGGIFKENLKAVIHHMSATKDELDLCIAGVVTARNRFMDRHGYGFLENHCVSQLRSCLLMPMMLNWFIFPLQIPLNEHGTSENVQLKSGLNDKTKVQSNEGFEQKPELQI